MGIFGFLGILVVVGIVGFLLLAVGATLFQGAIKLIIGIVLLMVLILAFKGCVGI